MTHRRILASLLVLLLWLAAAPAGATVGGDVWLAQYTGNGTTTSFAFSGQVFAPGDLSVVQVTPAGAVTIGHLNGGQPTDYSFSGTPDAATGEYLAGGTISFNSAPAAGVTVSLARYPQPQQPLSLAVGAPLPAKQLEAAWDRAVLGLQNLQGQLASAVVGAQLYDKAATLTLPLAGARASQLMGFDAAGNVALYPVAVSSATPNALIYVATLAQLQTTPIASAPSGLWRADYAAGNGAPAEFFTPLSGNCAAHSLTNDGGSCVNASDGNSWQGHLDGRSADWRNWGVALGNSNNQPAAQAAFNAAFAADVPLQICGAGEFAVQATTYFYPQQRLHFCPGTVIAKSDPTVSVTISIASPAVVSWTAHGLGAGQPVNFATTGSLPSGLAAATTYYVLPTNFGANSFEIAAMPGGAPIITSGSQSGTQSAVIGYAVLAPADAIGNSWVHFVSSSFSVAGVELDHPACDLELTPGTCIALQAVTSSRIIEPDIFNLPPLGAFPWTDENGGSYLPNAGEVWAGGGPANVENVRQTGGTVGNTNLLQPGAINYTYCGLAGSGLGGIGLALTAPPTALFSSANPANANIVENTEFDCDHVGVLNDYGSDNQFNNLDTSFAGDVGITHGPWGRFDILIYGGASHWTSGIGDNIELTVAAPALGSMTAASSGTTLTVSAVSSGTVLGVGTGVSGTGMATGSEITALGTGTGGAGTYTLSTTQTVSSETMYPSPTTLSYGPTTGLDLNGVAAGFAAAVNAQPTLAEGGITASVPFTLPASGPLNYNNTNRIVVSIRYPESPSATITEVGAIEAQGGSGCPSGSQTWTLASSDGAGTAAVLTGTVASGALSGALAISSAGAYTQFPTAGVALTGPACTTQPSVIQLLPAATQLNFGLTSQSGGDGLSASAAHTVSRNSVSGLQAEGDRLAAVFASPSAVQRYITSNFGSLAHTPYPILHQHGGAYFGSQDPVMLVGNSNSQSLGLTHLSNFVADCPNDALEDVNTSAGAITATLPGWADWGTICTFQDPNGGWATHNFTVQVDVPLWGALTINGGSSATYSTAYGSVKLLNDDGKWHPIP